MPSLMDWVLGLVVGFLVLMLGGSLVPQSGAMVRLIVTLIMLVGAAWLMVKTAHRGGD